MIKVVQAYDRVADKVLKPGRATWLRNSDMFP